MSLTKPKQSREGKPHNENQALASKENFALFILKGMQSNIIHLRKVIPYNMYGDEVTRLQMAIREAVSALITIQGLRMMKADEAKKLKKGVNSDG